MAALAFMAMATRAVVPAGYMLSPGDGGRYVAVTLCGEHGAIEALLDRETGAVLDPNQRPAPQQSNDDTPCAFAAAAAFAAPEAPLSFAFIRAAFSEPVAFLRDARPGLGLVAPPPFSTGPPLKA